MNLATIDRPGPRYFQLSWVAPCLIAGFIVPVILAEHFSLAFPEVTCASLLATFTVFFGVLAFKLVQQRSQLVWSPMPWLLMATSVYFGFGPLLYFFGAKDAKDYCEAVWPVTLDDLYWVTLVNGIGVALVFGVWWWRTRPMIHLQSIPFTHHGVVRTMAIFYVIGLPARSITLLSEFGLINYTAPSFLGWFGNFSNMGLVLLTATAFRRGGAWWSLCSAMLLLDVVAALGTFGKMPIVLSVMPCLLGYMLYRPGVKSLLWVPIILFFTYLAGNSYVTYCRANGWGGDTMATRIETAKSYFTSGQDAKQKEYEQSQNWWSRLNYANNQTFVMQDYKEGSPGNSFELALYAPIPRFLWPGKPIIESGYELYHRLTGGETASFGIGFFVEAYWNGGWLYVILSSLVVGWILGTITLVIAKEQSIENYWVLPIALLWIKSGCGVSGWIHTEIVGPGVFTIIYIGLMRYFSLGKTIPLRKSRDQIGKGTLESRTGAAV